MVSSSQPSFLQWDGSSPVSSMGKDMSVPGTWVWAVTPQSFCLSICSCTLRRSRHLWLPAPLTAAISSDTF